MTFNHHFVDGVFVEIRCDSGKTYRVTAHDIDTGNQIINVEVKSNHWFKTARKFFANCIFRVYDGDELVHSQKANFKDQRVFIAFESKALGDTLAWLPYVEEFRVKHECRVICSIFHAELFKKGYPNIKFVEPGKSVENIYGMFKLGWFLNEEQEVDYDRHPLDFKKQPLQKTATDILGLEFREIIPNISIKTEHEPLVTDKPFVAIATHGTAQAKYWNREGGWQAVVDAIKAKGYDVVMVSREEDGYMGNKNPDGIKYIGASTSFKPAIEHIKKAKLFIGLPSGLTWLSWGLNQQTFMVGGFSEAYTEPESIIKILPKEGICTGCFNEHRITAPWEWCPRHFGTERHFECTKTIEPERVIDIVEQFL